MLPCEQLELASQRSEAAGLDLDQQVAAEEIDDEAVDDPFDAIVGALIPVFELSVQRTLVEHSDRGALSFLGSGDLEEGAHDDAPSALRHSCLRQATNGPGLAAPLTREERPPPSLTGPVFGRCVLSPRPEPVLVAVQEPKSDMDSGFRVGPRRGGQSASMTPEELAWCEEMRQFPGARAEG